MTDKDRLAYHEARLRQMLETGRIAVSSAYTPGEVCAVLRISDRLFRQLCDCWEPRDIVSRRPEGLESYRAGKDRRVPHHALVEWLARNNSYERSYGVSA